MTNEEILNKIHGIKFYNVSYRKYFGIIENYIVGIYPFVTEIVEFNKDIKNFVENYSFYLTSDSITQKMRFHTIDFDKGKCNFCPCLLYEEITGDYIHTSNVDEKCEYSKNYYKEKTLEFNNKISNYFRKEKLKKLNTIHEI